MLRNFELLPFVNHMRKTECFAGDFMDDHWSFRICVQIPIILKNFLENASFLFSIKVQVTR